MFEIINYKGKKIYYLNASGMTIKDIDKIRAGMDKVKSIVKKAPRKSVLMITNVTNVRFNSEMAQLFKDYAAHNTPYVKASALVGISEIQKVILSTVKTLTGRDYYLANDLQEAKDWVVRQ